MRAKSVFILVGCTLFALVAFPGFPDRGVNAAELLNTAPTISPIPDRSWPEDTTRMVAFTVYDSQTDPGALAVSATSSDQVLLPDAGLTIGGTGMSRTLTIEPAADRYGTALVRVRVSDGELGAKEAFLVTIRPVNDPPFFTSSPPTTTWARATYVYAITTADADPGDARAIEAVVKPAWLSLVRLGGGAATLQGRPGRANLGTHRVRLVVTDAAGATAVQHFVITVLPRRVATPVIAQAGGVFASTVEVTISTATPGAAINYTTDGTTPSASSGTLYDGPVILPATATLKAVAYKTGWSDSAVASADFSFTPCVSTGSLTALDAADATISGVVNPRGLATTAWFEWGTDPGLSSPESSEPVDLGAGTDPLFLTQNLTGLSSGVAYYYRAVAVNGAGFVRGGIDSFALEPLDPWALEVNSFLDTTDPPLGKLTLRAAVERVEDGGTISFNPVLNGGTIDLSIIGESNSFLAGEVFTMSAGKWVFEGFLPRDYGKSALYAYKSLTIDASSLPAGITLNWAGGETSHARVLAVYGNLNLANVTVTGGSSVAEAIDGDPAQPFTLARGGAIAVWGIATLDHCVLSGNRCEGDTSGSRDRGAFGGGIYADTVIMNDCIVSGNAVIGFGAAGGGIYSVSGVGTWVNSAIAESTISGNRVTAQHAYGGGVYTDGGGPGNYQSLEISNCTIARNQVEDNPALPQSSMAQYYYRGGGVYMSNGYLTIRTSTIAENEVTGIPYAFSGKPNMGGGGVAATIGNAHVVEDMKVWHSIIAGNKVGGAPSDLYSGSLLEFYSYGYNLVGVIDFSQILVPIPAWMCLSRKHWPKVGDQEGVDAAQVLDLNNIRFHDSIISLGTDAGGKAVLWYPPLGAAIDRIPWEEYNVTSVWAQYWLQPDAAVDDFLNLILEKLRTDYADVLGSDFGTEFGDMTGVVWGGDAGTWPSDPVNIPWITFWRELDTAIDGRLGAAGLNDDFWGSFESGPFGDNIQMDVWLNDNGPVPRSLTDQIGNPRFSNLLADVGAIDSLH